MRPTIEARRLRWALLLLVVAVAGPAAGDDLSATQHDLYSGDVAQRVAAIRRLQEQPSVENAKLLARAQLLDLNLDVRRAAYKTLLAWKDLHDISDLLEKLLETEVHSKKGRPALIEPLTAVLLASDIPEIQRNTRRIVNGRLASSNHGPAILISVADALGAQGDRPAAAALRQMSELKFFATQFGFRRAVVQAICRIRRREAVELLIGLLPALDGEVRGDILRRLAQWTGKTYGADADAWRTWWKKSKEGFRFPAKDSPATLAPAATPGAPSYYGLTIQARRVVFVVDISGSMAGSRLATAARELTAAIEGLPGDASFNIVIFSSHAFLWQPKLTPATTAAKLEARQFIYSLRAGGRTAAYDALEMAFRFDAEAIYFLSDGEPNAGAIPTPRGILAAVAQTNRMRRISIYAIGIEPGLPGGPLDAFVRALAEGNFGVYRRVER